MRFSRHKKKDRRRRGEASGQNQLKHNNKVAAAGLEPAFLMQTITMRYCLQSITHHALPLGDAALSWTLQRYDLLSVAAKSDDDKGIFFYFSFFS